MPSLLRTNADFISAIEALYQPEPDTTRWAGDFLRALEGVVIAPKGLTVGVVAHEDDYSNAEVIFSVSSDASLAQMMARINVPDDELTLVIRDAEIFRAAYYPAHPVLAHSA